MKNIAIGQYYSADSIIHKLDPRSKIIASILYIVLIFLADNPISIGIILLSSFILVLISKIPLKIVLRSLKPILIVISFTALINIFWSLGEGEPLVKFWIIKIYKEGLINALYLIVRIFTLVIGSSVLLTYTTTPISLTDGIELLLSPLKKLKVPVHDFAMIMTIALRFIPTLAEETDKIMSAQKARGVDFGNGTIKQKVKSLIPILIPLFSSSIRHAVDLATAMECRLYRGGEGRTRMNTLTLQLKDYVFILLIFILLSTIVCSQIFLTSIIHF